MDEDQLSETKAALNFIISGFGVKLALFVIFCVAVNTFVQVGVDHGTKYHTILQNVGTIVSNCCGTVKQQVQGLQYSKR